VNFIEANQSDLANKCYEMFSNWLDSTRKTCWCQVADAFEMVGDNLAKVAGEIREKYKCKF